MSCYVVMLCYVMVMLCYVMLSYVMLLCYVTLRNVTLCYAKETSKNFTLPQELIPDQHLTDSHKQILVFLFQALNSHKTTHSFACVSLVFHAGSGLIRSIFDNLGSRYNSDIQTYCVLVFLSPVLDNQGLHQYLLWRNPKITVREVFN